MDQQRRRRRRAALSCLECRRRKIKCDKSDPCGHCVTNQSTCRYHQYRDEARLPSGSSPGLPTPSNGNVPLDRQASAQENASSRSKAESSTAVVHTENHDNDFAATSASTATLHSILHRIERLEQESSSLSPADALSATGKNVRARQSGLPESQIVLNKTRMWRWSNWMGLAPEFETIYSCFSAAMSDKSPAPGDELAILHTRICTLLGDCKATAKSIKVARPSRRLSFEELNLMPPSRDMADKMIDLYFKFFESTHRILHRPTFQSEYLGFWSDPQRVSNGARLKILLAVAIGSSVHAGSSEDFELQTTVHGWVYAAQTWLSGPLEKDRLDMTGLQVYCLTILSRQIFSIGGDLVWVSTGSLLHTAMQIGMHRDPKHLPAMSVLQAEMRRRLWATILEIAIQASLDSAMPPRISLDDFDTQAPSNNNDDEMTEHTTTLTPHPRQTYTTASLQLQLLDAVPTRLEILRLLNGLHSQISYQDVLKLGRELSTAHQSCIRFMISNKNCGVEPFHRNIVDLLFRRFFIPMHYPFAMEAATNPLFHFSRNAILDTALAIASPEPDESYSRLMRIGGGMIREAIRYAISVITFELLSQATAQHLSGTLHRNSYQLEFLKTTVRDMISLSAERVRAGETNIKGHMFLSMIMSQVEAMEADAPCDLDIARSAVSSLEYCLAIIRERAARSYLRSPRDGAFHSGSFASPDAIGLDFDFFLPDIDFE